MILYESDSNHLSTDHSVTRLGCAELGSTGLGGIGQSGFVSLMMAVVLLLGSTTYVRAHLAEQARNQSSRYLDAFEIFDVLHESKTALLAYAVSYADNYAPSGAGPGHFPCPDTDAPDDGNPYNDGPNPPCETLSEQVGRLPRLTKGTQPHNSGSKVFEFYPLRSLLDRQPWYIVAPGFVNNPTNRIVNTVTTSGMPFRSSNGALTHDLIALVAEAGPELRQWRLAASSQSRLQQRPGIRVQDYLELDSGAGSESYTRDYKATSNDFMLAVHSRDLWPVLERRVAGLSVSLIKNAVTRHCKLSTIKPCYLPAASVGSLDCDADLLIGALPIATGNCPFALAEGGLLEGVPITKHWFVRNQWYRYVGYEIDADCLKSMEIECEYSFKLVDEMTVSSARNHIDRGGLRIIINYAPRQSNFRTSVGRASYQAIPVSQLSPLGRVK